MKRILINSAATAVLALNLTGLAGAADLAVKAPIVAAPALSWTGIYLGVGGGTGWGTKEYSWDQDATMRSLLNQAGIVGPFPVFGASQGSHTINGGFFGGQIGGNWQAGWAVFGIQADAHWADISGRGTCFSPGSNIFGGTQPNCDAKVKSFGTVTGRVGAAVDRALLYVKGGLAWETGSHALRIDGFQTIGGGALPFPTITDGSVNSSRTGWTFGAGVEYAVSPNWSAFVEYNYLDFGTKGVNYALVANNVPVGPNLLTLNVPVSTDVSEVVHTVKAGVNYRFNWF